MSEEKVKSLMDEDSEEALKQITNTLNVVLNGEDITDPKYGFVILAFQFNVAPMSLMYVSNTQKEGMINLLRHQADVLENQGDEVVLEEPKDE